MKSSTHALKLPVCNILSEEVVWVDYMARDRRRKRERVRESVTKRERKTTAQSTSTPSIYEARLIALISSLHGESVVPNGKSHLLDI